MEIRTWLADKENLESFVILDDDNFWMWNWLSDRFVMTKRMGKSGSWNRELDDENVAKAIAILNGEYNSSDMEKTKPSNG